MSNRKKIKKFCKDNNIIIKDLDYVNYGLGEYRWDMYLTYEGVAEPIPYSCEVDEIDDILDEILEEKDNGDWVQECV